LPVLRGFNRSIKQSGETGAASVDVSEVWIRRGFELTKLLMRPQTVKIFCVNTFFVEIQPQM
jgi:hypothetical protein